jgi:AraC family transcriptional regulator
MNTAVERAITCMWQRYSEPLSLTDIARSAILSRFHFSRVFKDATGVSPGQFLSAVRIHQAKRMLLATSASVADVSSAVGYSSLGSFTNRFTDSVGLSPSRFRRTEGTERVTPRRGPSTLEGQLAGTLGFPAGYASALIYLGVFDTPIVQRRPRAAGVFSLHSSLPFTYRLGMVPAGTWFVHALAAADSTDPQPWDHRESLVCAAGPVVVTPGDRTLVTLALRPRQPTDLPVLLTLPELDAERSGPVLRKASLR